MWTDLVRSALERTGRAVINTAGTSMLPTIPPGSPVTITVRPFDAVRPGDVVAFAVGPDIFVHRVAERDRDRLVTIGDNMPLFDPPVRAEAFLGCAEGVDDLRPPPPDTRPRAADLTGATIWCPRRLVDQALTARLADLGATLELARPANLPAALAQAPGGTRIGVSAAGGGAAETIPILAGEHCHLLVGYRFGESGQGTTGSLAPDLAEHHVRPGAPLRLFTIEATLGVIAETFVRGGARGFVRTP